MRNYQKYGEQKWFGLIARIISKTDRFLVKKLIKKFYKKMHRKLIQIIL